tara:strand:+ start:5832 stop:7370 length:1539 start_codon:yes stop_codon:yes gene_type:complete
MSTLESLKPWLGRKSVRGLLLLAVIIVAAMLLSGQDDVALDAKPDTKTIVTTTTATEYVGGKSISLIGNVRAFTEAVVTAEQAGRVVGVNVSLGQSVSAGTVIATLENASERAAVLQAEGVYDAAVAAAAQSTVGVDEAQNGVKNAQNNAVSAFKSAFNVTNGVVLNNIDTFFSSPNTSVPGLKIDGRGFTNQLNQDRVSFQTLLSTWQIKTNTISSDSDLGAELQYASESVQNVINTIDTFIAVFNQQENSDRYSDAELQSFSTTFTSLRANLISTQSSLDAALTGLDAAADTLERAQLSSVGSVNSAADAQVKQALGSLRSAQANLAKTILRTPISGTINSLSVRTGDFINNFDTVAIVANNEALEVVTYISDTERSMISEGDTVLIEGQYEGVVTSIAPAVDPVIKKTQVRIATEGANIQNGDTVRISKEASDQATVLETVRVPLTAVKFDLEDGYMFTISDGRLVSVPVEIGNVFGSSVEILSGITSSDEFVVDARGLQVDEEVEIAN